MNDPRPGERGLDQSQRQKIGGIFVDHPHGVGSELLQKPLIALAQRGQDGFGRPQLRGGVESAGPGHRRGQLCAPEVELAGAVDGRMGCQDLLYQRSA